MRTAGNEAGHGVGLSIEQADAKDILEFKKRRNTEADGKA